MKAENETIICINDADVEEGFFSFSTSKRNHFARLIKKIGGEQNLIELKEMREKLGKVTEWKAKVPIEFLSKTHFGIRSRKKKAEKNRANNELALTTGQSTRAIAINRFPHQQGL